jgi:uncharacterized membrane protein
VRKSTPDKVLEDLSKFEGKVLKTSLSHEDEAKLQAALTKSELETDSMFREKLTWNQN